MAHIAFLGVGRMGACMAANLAKSGQRAAAEPTCALFERLGFGEKDFSPAPQLLRGRLEERR